MDNILMFVLFAVGLVMIIKGGDWFVDGASDLAKRFHVPDLLIGATIVSIGTTLPEVMVSTTSAIQGNAGISYGNAIGSIICNTALIAAITMALKPAPVETKSMITPVIFFFGTAVLYAANAYIFQYFDRWFGILMVTIFAVYIVLQIIEAVKLQKAGATAEVEIEALPEDGNEKKERPLWLQIVMLIVGAAFIAVGARLLVDNGTNIATLFGVPNSVIAVTFVALGTSLPELVTAITSLIKGHSDLSLGNIIGANFFNLALVSGVANTVSPFAIPSEKTIAGMNSSLVVDIPLVFIVMILMTVPSLIHKKISRYQGIILLLIYTAYVVYQFAF